MTSAFDMAAGQHWLILPNALGDLLAVSERLGDPAAVEALLGRKLDNTRTVSIRNGVAIVPIVGPIFRYANLFTEVSGATSTQILATDIRQALDNPAVKAIVLNIDSPGGVASGINELAEQIYAGRSEKRIVAYVGGTGASAAYWLASAAHEVVVDDTALLGSIGVVVEVVVAAANAKGPKTYQIVSSNAPNKRPDTSTEQGRAKIGETVNAMAGVFEAKVARNLGVTRQKVPAMGDHGGLRVGKDAVRYGLAHSLGSLEGVIASLSKGSPIPARGDPGGARSSLPTRTTEQIRCAEILALVQPGSGLDLELVAAIEGGLSVEAAALSFYQAMQSRSSRINNAAAATIHQPAQRPSGTSQGIYRARRPGRS